MRATALTFNDHLKDLRKRVGLSFVVFIVGSIVGYFLRKPIFNLLKRPLHESLYYTTPTGAFNVTLRVSTLIGLVILLPIATYNLVSFIQPAFDKKISKSYIRQIALLSLILGLCGALFAYSLVVPMALHFFGEFKSTGINSLISANAYLTFIATIITSFVILFQIPLIIFFIDRITPLTPKKLLHYERHVFIASLVLALVLPFTYDPVTEFLIAVPIFLLYNLSIFLIWLSHREPNHKLSNKLLEAELDD